MAVTDDLVDLTLHHLGRTGYRPFLVIIGAMDGVSFDDFHGYIVGYEWSGLFVEPIAEQFNRLCAHYASLPYRPDNRYENCAIAEHDGTVRMLTIDQGAVDRGEVHPALGGMSAIDPPRNGLAQEAAVVERYGRRIDVPCLTLRSLFQRHGVDRVDVLCIDAEGWDYRILRQLDFITYRPKLIRCEFVNLPAPEQFGAVRLLERHGYVVRLQGANLDAVPREIWEVVRTAARANPVAAKTVRPGAITLVTGLFDLSAGERDLRLRLGFARYLDETKRLLALDWPMVIFADPALAELIHRYRQPANTWVVLKSERELERAPFFHRVQQIRAQAGAPNDADPVFNGLGWRLRLYNAFALSKQFFLNDAAIMDPFDTEAFLWIDGDIGGAIGDPQARFTEPLRRRVAALFAGNRMLYLCRPWGRRGDGPRLGRAQMAELTGEEPAHLVSGRCFGGTREAVSGINAAYFSHLMWSLERGYMGTEEHILTMLSYTHAALCTLQKLPPRAWLRAFFDRMADRG
jgi:FkbM family methyltransferase